MYFPFAIDTLSTLTSTFFCALLLNMLDKPPALGASSTNGISAITEEAVQLSALSRPAMSSTESTISHEALDQEPEDSDDGSDDDFHSFDSDSDSDEKTPQSAEDKQADKLAREHERERVLQAAGLVIKPVDKQTLTRVRSLKRGRPPPPPPIRRQG